MLTRVKEPTIGEIHVAARERLSGTHLKLMDKIMQLNKHRKKYWILGKSKCIRKNGRTTIRPFLKAYKSQPDVQKESYLYEIDNEKNEKTLVWVMHPNNKLSIPSINKTISAAG